MTAHRVPLRGLEAVSLADYLAALGVLRAVAGQVDAEAVLGWDHGVPILESSLDAEQLVDWLTDGFVPSPLISPWNAGSGFAGNGKSKEAEKALAAVVASDLARLAPLREAIAAGRAVVAEGRARGWAGGTMWDAKHKTSLLTLCRNRLPDEVLPWLDTALALDGEGVFYNPLAGSGGNFGRQDLSAGYIQQLLQLMGPDARRRTSADWARSVVTGQDHAPYARGTVGQFDPGRSGGIHSTVFEKLDDKGFINPWRMVLTCEGLLLFASSATRRNAAGPAQSSPFVVRSTPYGYGTASAAEATKAELWAPMWRAPARLPELEQLLGEGRAQYRGRQARSGFDFARAAGTFGVDRNLSAFRRFVIVERLGQNPLAIRAGDVPVGLRSAQLALLREAFDWVQRLREPLPAGIGSLLRQTEASMFALAAGTRNTEAETQTFVRLFGQLHEAVARSGAVRGRVRPFVSRERPGPPRWALDAPAESCPELAVAVALAGLAEVAGAPALRAELTRSRPGPKGTPVWDERPASGLDLSTAGVAQALAAVHQRHLRAGTASRSDGGPAAPFLPKPGRSPLTSTDPLQDFLDGHLDDRQIAELLVGLLILGWRTTFQTDPDAAAPAPGRPLRAELSTLLPFYGGKQLGTVRIAGLSAPTGAAHAERFAPQLRPRPDWATRLRAGRVTAVLADARLRMKLAQCPPVTPRHDDEELRQVDGTRLAAALLIPVTPRVRTRALTAASTTTTAAPLTDSTTDTETATEDSAT